jgi:hypothetical protein
MTPSRWSSRERMLAAIKRQGPDHVPFSPILAQGPQWPAPLFWRDQIERGGGLILSAIIFGNLSQRSIMLMIEAWRKYCLDG